MSQKSTPRLLCLLSSIAFAACVAPPGAPERDADASVGLSEEAVTAQPDPSCTYARLGTHDYWVCNAAKTFTDAQNVCASVAMNLVRVDTAAESDFVKTQMVNDSWIGATDQSVEGAWRWLDGNVQFWSGAASGSVVGGLYSRWTSGEPNDFLGEDCGAIVKSSGSWGDYPCGNTKSFVCESNNATAGQPQAPDTACTRTTRNGSTYWTCSNQRTWDEARANCQSIGLDLASVDDAAEGTFLAPSFAQSPHIGLSDRDEEDTWRWAATGAASYCGATSGSRTPYGRYSNWSTGQPAHANDCKQVKSASRSYWACKNWVTWQNAGLECSESGMSLARIDDTAENALVKSAISVDSWLGASDVATEGKWLWPDGVQYWNGTATGTAVAGRFSNWVAGEPNDQFALNEDCVEMLAADGRWNDTLCDAPFGGIGFVCEGKLGSRYPDRNDCAFANTNGTWSAGLCATKRAYVCETVPAAATAKLDDIASDIRENHRVGAPRVMGFDVKAGVTVKEPFLGREDRLGLRTCQDSLEPFGAVTQIPKYGVEQLTYAQYYQGVRVHGRGYSVYRNPSTKNVVSVLGEIAPKLDLSVTPAVTEAQARSTAIAALGRVAADYPTPAVGQLLIFPKKQGRDPQWELTWIFVLRRNATDDGFSVGVSARTGAVVATASNLAQCDNGLLPSPVVQSSLRVDTPQSLLFNDPNLAVATYTTQTGVAKPTYLYSQGASLDSTSPLFTRPIISAACGTGEYPEVMRTAAGPISYETDPGAVTDEEEGAAMFLATQRSIEAFSRMFERNTNPPTPWLGVDGVGLTRIELRVMDGEGTGYSPGHSSVGGHATIIVDPHNFQTPQGASFDIAAHELGHAVLANYMDLLGPTDLETRSVSEGYGDVIAAATETFWRTDDVSETGAYCALGDLRQAGQGCLRDFVIPGDSTQAGCKVKDALGTVIRSGCPESYHSLDYCDSNIRCADDDPPQPGCCDEHINATVFDHWFYIVTNGDAGINDVSCSYKVAPIAATRIAAITAASRIVFEAVRDKAWSNLQFTGIAEATIKAAEKIYGVDSPQASTVAGAWYAVNVREDVLPKTVKLADGSILSPVTPKRGATKVHPWVTFSWRVPTTETSWDFQLDDQSFQGSNVLWEQKAIKTVTTLNGQRTAYFSLALPENRTSHFVWRVRPTPAQAGVPWGDCYAINWFDDTTAMTPVPGLSPGPIDPATSLLTPGSGYVVFAPAIGMQTFPEINGGKRAVPVTGYRTQLGTQNVGCASNPAVPEQIEPPVTPEFLEEGMYYSFFNDIQPNKLYTATVTPIGPVSIETGQPAYGPCATVTLSSGAPTNAPTLISPVGQRFNLYSPHERDPQFPSGTPTLEWSWYVESWVKKSRVEFRARDTAGACTAAVLKTVNVTTPACTGSLCSVSLTGDLFPKPLPGGYCWDVTGIAADNVTTSPKATGKWGYYVNAALDRSPGAIAGSGTSGAILGDSYGAPVTLRWSALPNASGYSIKLWKWLSAYGTQQLDNPTTFIATVGGSATSVIVPAAKGGMGRYCWEVTPIIEDPNPKNPGAAAAVQPAVYSGSPICYTTGPSKPVITIDNPPASAFTNTPVTGSVRFDYVPDQQYTANSSGWSWQTSATPWCTTLNQVFTDIVGCTRKFTIPAVEAKKVDVTISVFNSASKPGTNKASELVGTPATKSVRFGKCGGSNEACCASAKCDSATLACNGSNVCVTCGNAEGALCCASSKCNGSLKCGGAGTCYQPLADVVREGDIVYDFKTKVVNFNLRNVGEAGTGVGVKVFVQASAGSLPNPDTGTSEEVGTSQVLTGSALNAGQAGNWWFIYDPQNWAAKAPFDVTIFIDPNDEIRESNEQNNGSTQKIPGQP